MTVETVAARTCRGLGHDAQERERGGERERKRETERERQRQRVTNKIKRGKNKED